MSSDSSLIHDVPLVVNEVSDERPVGEYIGNVKWFSDRLGYGFITIQNGPHKGIDCFVYHAALQPLNSVYKSLSKGEYVALDIVDGAQGKQCANVTGVLGGALMADQVTPPRPYAPYPHSSPPAPPTTPSPHGVRYHSTSDNVETQRYSGGSGRGRGAGGGRGFERGGRGESHRFNGVVSGRGRGRGGENRPSVQTSFGDGF